MLGTDYPFPLGELSPGSLIESMDELGSLKVILKNVQHFSNEHIKFPILVQQEKLLYENALEFLNIDRTRFEN